MSQFHCLVVPHLSCDHQNRVNSPYHKAAKFLDTLHRLVIDSETLMDLKRQLRNLFPVFDDTFYLV